MAITVTLPVEAPTNVSATLLEGGNLLPNTTYYLVMFGNSVRLCTPYNFIQTYQSPISEGISFTTTDTHKSIRLNWTNSVGATYYGSIISKISGDYRGCATNPWAPSYYCNIDQTNGLIGVIISEELVGGYAHHAVQAKDNLPGNISKSLGTLKISFSGTGTYNLEDVYNQIVNSGFSDYVNYDGYNFFMMGALWSSGVDAGRLYVVKKNIILIRGFIYNSNPNFIFQFGSWNDTYDSPNMFDACKIDILNGRNPLLARYPMNIQMYGCVYTQGKSYLTSSESVSTSYLLRGGVQSVYGYVDGYRLCMMGVPFRAVRGNILDTTFSQVNNFVSGKHIRCHIQRNAWLPYSNKGSFYECRFTDSRLYFYSRYSYGRNGHNTNFYDCIFPYPLGQPSKYYFSFRYLSDDNDYKTDQFVRINHSVNIRVIDSTGNPLENAIVKCVDNFGNPANWIEHDQTTDKIATGIESNDDRLTDANGLSFNYLTFYKSEQDPASTATHTCYDKIQTDYYPYVLKVSKEGFEPFEIVLAEATKFDLLIVLKEVKPKIYTNQQIAANLNPTKEISVEIKKQILNAKIEK